MLSIEKTGAGVTGTPAHTLPGGFSYRLPRLSQRLGERLPQRTSGCPAHPYENSAKQVAVGRARGRPPLNRRFPVPP
ncbi:MAG: hypothetical protein P1P73_01560 [Brevefilum sp.]|nr:hypothetical protein [Brevefilum sp.]